MRPPRVGSAGGWGEWGGLSEIKQGVDTGIHRHDYPPQEYTGGLQCYNWIGKTLNMHAEVTFF